MLMLTHTQRKYHELFIQSGGLGVLKAWIDPYADGTLPNARVRACILNCCQVRCRVCRCVCVDLCVRVCVYGCVAT